jgi:hypothetical protein
MSTPQPQPIGPATRKVLAGIDDPELEARYPNRTHFIDAQNPHQALMTSRALFSGDPVVVVYQDGREVLFTPEPAHGLVAASSWSPSSGSNYVSAPQPTSRYNSRHAPKSKSATPPDYPSPRSSRADATHPGESKTEKEEAAFSDLVLLLQSQGVRIDLTGALL